MIRSDESGWDHWIGYSATPTLLLLRRSLSAQWSYVFQYMRLTLFVPHIMRLFPQPDEFYASKKCLYSLKYILKCSVVFLIILCIYYWHYTSSCNRRGVLFWKCISMFVMVLVVLIYHEQSRLHYTYARTLVTSQTNLKLKLIHPEGKQARSQVV